MRYMECRVELEGVDLHASGVVVNENNNIMNNHHHHLVVGFEETMAAAERDIWLNGNDDDDLLGVNDPSMFYADFPPLPDFPCMSSSSSSSSTPALPVKTTNCTTTTTRTTSSSSSSSAASWAVLRSDFEENLEQNNYNCCMQNEHQQQHDHNQHDVYDIGPAGLSSNASMEVSQQHHYLNHQQQNHDPCLDGTVGDCMDEVMDFGYMELFEGNEFFDPASIFQSEENPLVEFTQVQTVPQQEEHQHAMLTHHYQESTLLQHQGVTNEEDNDHHNQALMCAKTTNNNDVEIVQGEADATGAGVDDEMSSVFLEWLKSNKDSVSANDLRSVKLKKATIESAAKRLGGGKEAMKQLLKLILEWVQTSHLQNKRRKESNESDLLTQFQDPIQSQNRKNTSSNLHVAPDQSNTCFNQTPWVSVSQQNYGTATDQAPLMTVPQSFPQQMVGGYLGDPYTNGGTASNNHNPYQPSAEYQMLESAPTWPPSQFTTVANSQYNQSFGDSNLHPQMPAVAAAFGSGYGNQYPYQFFHHGPGGDRLMRLGPSATREARKKRMARQRKLLSHHRHNNQNQNQPLDPHARLGSDNCTTLLAPAHANQANWVYWQTMTGGAAPMVPVVPVEPPAVQQVVDRTTMQTQNTQNYHQGRVSSDKRQQGWKPEKNLKFLLQKVLKQSDVGSLGRIVLPKKEAETHLPELEARDGISITMEDIGTSRVWNMRYSIRYWPNNKSRMYLLENTGDFVRANGLQEGDFIVIYSDVKCGKFMIRGVKVRQQGMKAETKKGGKMHKNQQHGNNNAATTAGAVAAINNGSSSSPKHKNEKLAR
ncbi:PREDICTED: B3 domain-containing transcription factor ABI3-like isoform X1 [Lupinus angustifolius]|uniref:B3 domain-containing transcription factor ABI3-like isoform X1 n=1 Tax=Lupinus angustifolius TaxID=3871 RepID=UPI00092F6A7C|nr:PREDICTED: B3 domain-containing transcription factor ABI3-like isoform X1 [Lupinus angustifolius]